MPRPRKIVRSVEVNVLLPMDTAAAMDILLWDPVLQKPKYGARSALIAELINAWIKSKMPDFEAPSSVPEA